jgi:hypothetical protein
MAVRQGARPSGGQMHLGAFTFPRRIFVHGRVVHLRRVADAMNSDMSARTSEGADDRNRLTPLACERASAPNWDCFDDNALGPPVQGGSHVSALHGAAARPEEAMPAAPVHLSGRRPSSERTVSSLSGPWGSVRRQGSDAPSWPGSRRSRGRRPRTAPTRSPSPHR